MTGETPGRERGSAAAAAVRGPGVRLAVPRPQPEHEPSLASGPVSGCPKAATSCAPGLTRKSSVMPASTRPGGPSTWTASLTYSQSANRDDGAGR